MEQILANIQPELFILIIFIYALGLFLKLNDRFKKEYTIPYILLLVSVITCILWMGIVLSMGFKAIIIITAVVQGVLIAAIAVFGNELIKQQFNKKFDDVTYDPKDVSKYLK